MLGIGLLVPALPLLVGEFVATKELQAQWYGILASVFGLLQFLCMPLLGVLSDKVGRRPVMLYSMAGMCLNFLTTALAPNLPMLFLGRVIGGMSAASMSVASAYASDISTPENRAKSFGLIGAAFGFGFICGPALGGLLGHFGMRVPFYLAAVLSACNFLYGYFVVPESLPLDRRAPFTLARANPFGSLFALARRRDVRGLIVALCFSTFAQMLMQTTWVLYTHFRFGWGTVENGWALTCVGIASAVVQAVLLGRMIKLFGEVRLALLGLASSAITFVFYGLATEGWMMYVLIMCNLLAFGTAPAMQAIISKATDPRAQGQLMGSLQSIASFSLVIAPYFGASILGRVSELPRGDWHVGTTFFIGAALQATALVVAWLYFRAHKTAVAAPPQAG
ncbi:MAG: MFS transporter [Burkholderiaceae bacterium]|nr:MFS transporter [Burkholderiaceae bacterium]